MLICPAKILKISGNSSIESLRIILPKPVKRSASGKRLPFSSFALVIVRYLIILKILPFLPGRGCTKNGLPCIAIATIGVNSKKNGDNTITAKRLRMKSSRGLKKCLYITPSVCLRWS